MVTVKSPVKGLSQRLSMTVCLCLEQLSFFSRFNFCQIAAFILQPPNAVTPYIPHLTISHIVHMSFSKCNFCESFLHTMPFIYV